VLGRDALVPAAEPERAGAGAGQRSQPERPRWSAAEAAPAAEAATRELEAAAARDRLPAAEPGLLGADGVAVLGEGGGLLVQARNVDARTRLVVELDAVMAQALLAAVDERVSRLEAVAKRTGVAGVPAQTLRALWGARLQLQLAEARRRDRARQA
jgi:hypothetical protein